MLPNPRAQRLTWWVFAGGVAAAFAWFVLRPLVAPLVLAALITVIFQPLHRRLERWLGGRRVVAASASMLLILLVVGAPAAGFGFLLSVQARRVVQELAAGGEAQSHLAALLQRLGAWLSAVVERLLGQPLDLGPLRDQAVERAGWTLYESLPDAVGGAGHLLLAAAVLGLTLFFLLWRGGELVELLVELSPMGEGYTRRILERLESTVQGVFIGALLTATAQGALGALAFSLTGFPSYLVWGALLAGASFIPVVGTGLIWGPATLYLLSTGGLRPAALMFFFGLFISTVDNLLRPLLIHGRSAVHPLVLFLALLGGLQTLGVMGLIYGPLLAACWVETVRIYRSDFAAPSAPPPGDVLG